MDNLIKVVKYLAFVFFLILFGVSLYQKVDLIANHDFIDGVFQNGGVFIKDEQGVPKKIDAFYTNSYDNNEVVSIFYNAADNNGVVFEFDKFFRDILLLILINGLCLTMIILDRKKPTL